MLGGEGHSGQTSFPSQPTKGASYQHDFSAPMLTLIADLSYYLSVSCSSKFIPLKATFYTVEESQCLQWKHNPLIPERSEFSLKIIQRSICSTCEAYSFPLLCIWPFIVHIPQVFILHFVCPNSLRMFILLVILF